MSKSINISNSVIRRLPRYYRFLGELEDQQISKISSRELSERMHLTASQIRQDLNCFGGFGQQGYGYNVSELRKEIGRILGVDKHRKRFLSVRVISALRLPFTLILKKRMQSYRYIRLQQENSRKSSRKADNNRY